MAIRMTPDDAARWAARMQPFPLPPNSVPSYCDVFEGFTDDELLAMPPQLIGHLQRTSAQGGLQIISPRQSPFTWTMSKTMNANRDIGDHVVGSVCDPSNEWPTLDDADFSDLLPDQPLPSIGVTSAERERTRTMPLTSAGGLLSDPILACLVKGRAVIDVLSRSDVQGDAQGMTELLADAWGIPVEALQDLDAFTIGVDGPLQRHCMRVDEVYPTTYAPVHVRRVVSVGASDIDKTYLPELAATDWRRMRVFCEAVFIMSCENEGLPIKYMRSSSLPGDMTAPMNRPGVLGFRPLPGNVWSYAPSTFSIQTNSKPSRKSRKEVPPDVLEALGYYLKKVTPLCFAMSRTSTPSLKVSQLVNPGLAHEESIVGAMGRFHQYVMSGSARGRNAAATIRSCIYETLEGSPNHIRARLARYIKIAPAECKAHLGTTEVPDMVVDRIASRFLEVGSLIRSKIAAESTRRGETVEGWWRDLVSQAPDRYKNLAEGTSGWAKVAMWLVFRSPTERWDKLVSALHFSALRAAAKKQIHGVPLSPEVGSKERLLGGCRAVAKSMSMAYAGYYSAVSDVALAISDAASELKRYRLADILREAGYLWILRSRALRASNVNVFPDGGVLPNANHYMVPAFPVNLVLAPAPYRPFTAYLTHAENSKVLLKRYKSELLAPVMGKVSGVFLGMTGPAVACTETVVTRYLATPWRLGEDMDRGWEELSSDIVETALHFRREYLDKVQPVLNPRQSEVAAPEPDLGTGVVDKLAGNYFDIIAELTQDELDGLEDMVYSLDPPIADMIYEGTYPTVYDLLSTVEALFERSRPHTSSERETVA